MRHRMSLHGRRPPIPLTGSVIDAGPLEEDDQWSVQNPNERAGAVVPVTPSAVHMGTEWELLLSCPLHSTVAALLMLMCRLTYSTRFIMNAVFPVLLTGVLASLSTAGAESPKTVAIGQLVGPATLQGLNGPSRRLSEYRGKPLIINVWASWCAPCRDEMASLERLAWSKWADHFNIIGISTDDYRAQAMTWLSHSNATLNQFIDSHQQMEGMLGASRLPLTVLVDADGRIVDKIYGARQWDSQASLDVIEAAFQWGSARK